MRIGWPAAVAGLLLALSGCGVGGEATPPPTPSALPQSMSVTSTAFAEGAAIPVEFTCRGGGGFPPVRWAGAPPDTKGFALVVDDPDAPSGTFVHWIVADLPADATTVDPGAVPSGAKQADNSSGGAGWTPPCPPSGNHHYRFTVYALTGPSGVDQGAEPDSAQQAIQQHASAYGRLTGTVSAS